jgi:cold shock CspA family protein
MICQREDRRTMKKQPQVTVRGAEVSPEIQARCFDEIDKLEHYCDRITSCNVVITASHQRHHQGNLWEIRVDMTVPDQEIVVSRTPDQHRKDEDIEVAVSDAFKRARRQLEDYVRKHRHLVKTHEEHHPLGRVVQLDAYSGHGFLEGPEGRQVYFHKNAVPGDGFDRLEVGTEVHFKEEPGDKGPQASWVEIR